MSTVVSGCEHGGLESIVATVWEHGAMSALLHCWSMVAEFLGRCERFGNTFYNWLHRGCECSYD